MIVIVTIKIKSYDDGINAKGILQVDNGDITVRAKESLTSTSMILNNGTFTISASIYGMKVEKNSPTNEVTLNINGGKYKINIGPGNTCAIYSNNTININGGYLDIDAKTPFNYSGKATYNKGTIIIDGEETNAIPEVESMKRSTNLDMMPEGDNPKQIPNNNKQTNKTENTNK